MKSEIIKIGILSEFWEKQKKDIIDIVLPIIKCAISENYNKNGKFKVVNKDEVLNCLKRDYNKNFTMLLLKNAMNRLTRYSILEIKDEEYLVIDEESIEAAVQNNGKVSREVEDEWNSIIKDLKKFLDEKSPIPFLKKIKIEEKLWSFLNIVSNNFEEGFADEPVDRMFSYYLIEKKNRNDDIYKYIKKIITSIFIAKSINIYQISESKFWDNKRIIVDTRFLMNVLDMNCTEENEASKEIYNILKKSSIGVYTFIHNVEEIDHVIEAYNHQKKTYNYLNTDIDLFSREKYSESMISIFRQSLRKNIENAGIIVLESEYKSDKNIVYKEDFNNNYVEGNNSLTKAYDEKNYVSTLVEYEKDKNIVFISIGNGLYNIYKKCSNRNIDSIVFMSESDLASLYFINNTSNCSNYSINKVISLAYMLQEPSEEFYKSLMEVLNKLKANGGITEESIMIFAHNNMISKEMGIAAGYTKSEITEERIKKVLEQYDEKVKKPFIEALDEKDLEISRINCENEKVKSSLENKISMYESEIDKLKENSELKEQMYNQTNDKLLQVEKYNEVLKRPIERIDSGIRVVAKIGSIVLVIVFIIILIIILLILYNIIMYYSSSKCLVDFISGIISLSSIIAIFKYFKKIYSIIYENIYNYIRSKLYK